jgi:ABC-2 type transport system permease protein
MSEYQTLEDGALAPEPGAAPVYARVVSQAAFDALVMLRNGEQLLLTILLPVLILLGLVRTGLFYLPAGIPRVDVATPGVLALAVMSTAFTGQAIATGFDRRNGVLRLLGTTPLGRGGLLTGRVLAVIAVELIQGVVICTTGFLLGWDPDPAALLPATCSLLLGTACFVALGLLLAGTLRAEAVLAAANLIWVLMLALGGIVVPIPQLGILHVITPLLPPGALGEAVRSAFEHGEFNTTAMFVLMAWTLAASLAAARWFRWD